MKKYLVAIFILSTLLLLTMQNKQEKVARSDGKVVVFESGNYARVYGHGADIGIRNPANLRTYEKFTFDNQLIEKGLYEEGVFLPENDEKEKAASFLFILDFAIVAIYLTFYFRRDFIFVRDWYINKTTVPFTVMTIEQLKSALRDKMSCERCNASPDFSVEKETRVQGMIFIEGKCRICLEQKKIRVK